MSTLCKNCSNRIYLGNYLDKPAWVHHGSNFIPCYGGLDTVAEPAEPTSGEPPICCGKPMCRRAAFHGSSTLAYTGFRCSTCGIETQVQWNCDERREEASNPGPAAPPQSAREFRDRVRDNYVLRVVGAGLDTRAEYDEPAIMDAYASECVKRERERCAKIAREYADDTGDIGLEPSKSEFDRGWLKASTRIHATIERGEG